MKLTCLLCLLRLSMISIHMVSIYLLCAHGELRSDHYDLRDQDNGINEGVLKVTSSRSRLQCMTLCMATDQCVTAGYVANKCTLSTRRIDGAKSYSKSASKGERLYTVRCLPRWSGMCRVMNITGVDYGNCNGIYTLVEDMVAYHRPVYMMEAQYRMLYYHVFAWIIGKIDIPIGSGWQNCHADDCAPDMPQCNKMKIECLGWLP